LKRGGWVEERSGLFKANGTSFSSRVCQKAIPVSEVNAECDREEDEVMPRRLLYLHSFK
jgi:hypothetical protein